MRPFVIIWGMLITGVLGYAAWVGILWLSDKAGRISRQIKWRKDHPDERPEEPRL